MTKQSYQCFFCNQPISIWNGEGYCCNHGGTKIKHSISIKYSIPLYPEDEYDDTGFDFVAFDIDDYEVIYDIKSLRGGIELDVWEGNSNDELNQNGIILSLKDFGDTKPITPENAEEKIKTYLLFS